MIISILALPVRLFRFIMDPRVSPLRHLAPAQRFQVTCVLGLMWTTIFTFGTGFWWFYGELVVLHVLMAAGTLVTGATFGVATSVENRRAKAMARAPQDRQQP